MEFSQQLDGSDAIILISPEYSGSYSGVLKNALEYFGPHEFRKKPIGVVSVSAGRLGGVNASTQMQLLILAIGGYPMPLKLLVPEVQKAFDSNGDPVDEYFQNTAQRFLDELIWFTEAIVNHKELAAHAVPS